MLTLRMVRPMGLGTQVRRVLDGGLPRPNIADTVTGIPGPDRETFPMADASLDTAEQVARVLRSIEETQKFVAEQRKLMSEQAKLQAEAAKMERDRALAPWQIVVASMAAGAAFFGAGAAFIKLLT